MSGHGFHTDGLGLGTWYKSAGQTGTVVVERHETDALTMFIHVEKACFVCRETCRGPEQNKISIAATTLTHNC